VQTVTIGGDGIIHKGIHNSNSVGGLNVNTLSQDFPTILSNNSAHINDCFVAEFTGGTLVYTDVLRLRPLYTRVGNIVRCTFNLEYEIKSSSITTLTITIALRFSKHTPSTVNDATSVGMARPYKSYNFSGRFFVDNIISNNIEIVTGGGGSRTVLCSATRGGGLAFPGYTPLQLYGDFSYAITDS
jgi:hypothetical protein